MVKCLHCGGFWNNTRLNKCSNCGSIHLEHRNGTTVIEKYIFGWSDPRQFYITHHGKIHG